MRFDPQLIKGRLIRRYKRFLADVEIDTAEGPKLVVAHCANTGSMRHCLVPQSECWLSLSDNPKRKLAYSLEAVTSEFGGMAGVNTSRANKLVAEALAAEKIPELSGYDDIRPEVKFGEQNSRLDFCLSSQEQQCLVEVKNVTMAISDDSKNTIGEGAFPDSVTERGRKHIGELVYAVNQGHRAVLLFCVQHSRIERVRPAWNIDPDYAQTLVEAVEAGVEVLAYRVSMSREEFIMTQRLDFVLDPAP